jgi:hypothetical protein
MALVRTAHLCLIRAEPKRICCKRAGTCRGTPCRRPARCLYDLEHCTAIQVAVRECHDLSEAYLADASFCTPHTLAAGPLVCGRPLMCRYPAGAGSTSGAGSLRPIHSMRLMCAIAKIQRPLARPTTQGLGRELRFSHTGLFLVLLAVLHALALLYWLYMLSLGPSITSSSAGAPKQFKKLRVVYDFLESSATVIGSHGAHRATPEAQSNPMKRNRSYPNIRSAANDAGL